jgi:hypothetical protein
MSDRFTIDTFHIMIYFLHNQFDIRVDSTRSVEGFVCHSACDADLTRKRVESTKNERFLAKNIFMSKKCHFHTFVCRNFSTRMRFGFRVSIRHAIYYYLRL